MNQHHICMKLYYIDCTFLNFFTGSAAFSVFTLYIYNRIRPWSTVVLNSRKAGKYEIKHQKTFIFYKNIFWCIELSHSFFMT